MGDFQFWRSDAYFKVEECHGEDGYDDGKVTDELADLKVLCL